MRPIDADATLDLLNSLGNREYRRSKGTIIEAEKMLVYEEYTPTLDVIVLPCKIGDTVYLINDGKIYEATVYRIEYIDHDPFGITTTVSARTQLSYKFGISFDDFGKIAFLTREEAEAELKKNGGGK